MQQNPGVYFEIPVLDMERAIRFYTAVFGYSFEREEIHGNSMALFPLDESKDGITGALAKGKIYKPTLSGCLIYLSTPDIAATLALVTANGGRVLFLKSAVGQTGYVAEFRDSEGNRIALFEKKKA
jgi:uncharacterized protein